jgi:hypothetical protein
MTDQLEADLRAALTKHTNDLPPDASARLREIDYRPRSPRIRTALMLSGTTSVVLAAAVVLSIVGIGTGTKRAFADWTPEPTAPASGQTSAASEACMARLATSAELEHADAGASGSRGPSWPVPTIAAGGWRAVITDTRGPFTMFLYEAAEGRAEASCFSGPFPSTQPLGMGMTMGDQPPASVPSGQVSVTSTGGGVTPATAGEQAYTRVVGRTGADVEGVTLTLSDRTHVTASDANGWFLAWWPGTQEAVTAEVTTASGTHTQQLDLPHCRLC